MPLAPPPQDVAAGRHGPDHPLPQPPRDLAPCWSEPWGRYSLLRTPWRRLTRHEFDELRLHIPNGEHDGPGPGRPRNLRAVLDGIFWVACSTGPWNDMPAEFGKPDTASRNLRRWARQGVVASLLAKATRQDASPLLIRIAYWIARAFRRMSRIVPLLHIRVAVSLRAIDSWPANPVVFPDGHLSERGRAWMATWARHLETHRNDLVWALRTRQPEKLVRGLGKLHRNALRCWRAGKRLLDLGELGNRREWRLK